MKKHPSITLGITNYNNAIYLQQCVDSVLNQTYPSVEIIVVDDCSTDNSLKLLENYSDRIKLIRHEQNTGSLVQGRIDVINSAQGEYIAHLDADDFWHPKFVERLMAEFLQNPELDWVIGNTNLVNSGGFVINKWDYSEYSTNFEHCIKRGFATASLPFPNNGIFKASFLRKNNLSWYRLPNTLQGEDALTATKYLECRPKLKQVNEYLFNYRLHGSNMSAKPAERIKMIIDLKEYYFNTFDTKLLFADSRLSEMEYGSNEYFALSHLLLANDLLQVKQNIKIPAVFCNENTERDILENLWFFDKPIKRHAEQSLQLTDLFSRETAQVLHTLKLVGAITEGRKKLILGNFESARETFREIVNSSVESAEALCGMGEAYFLTGDIERAEEFTARAVQSNPLNSKVLNNAGAIFSAKNDTANAVRAFISSIKSDPHNSDAHLNLAAIMAAFSKDLLVSEDLKLKLLETIKWLSNNYPDHSRENLLIENWRLATDVVNQFRGIYSHSEIRVLLHQPNNGALKYLMQSWQEVLTHMGIKTDVLQWNENTRDKFSAFQPDVFISVNETAYLEQIDLGCIEEWRKYNGMKYGLILSYDRPANNSDFQITFHRNPQKHSELSKTHLPLISLPFAANPLKHFMRPGRAIWDYFFVGTNSDFKQKETDQFLSPILQNHNGILAGVNWNRGLSELSIDETPFFYSFAKICPNYHVARQIEEYNEVNERAFIIPACGGFQITDNPKAMKDCFSDNEMAVAHSSREYQEMFRHFLTHDEERTAFIQNGMRRVFHEHTLFHVLTRLAEHLGVTNSTQTSENKREELWHS